MEDNLELTLTLKHIEQHLVQNDANTKKLIKLQQRIISKDRWAVKIYQAYESVLLDIGKNLNTVDKALRLCEVTEDESDFAASDDENQSIPLGALVAALTLTAEGSEEWILAKVKSLNPKNGKYYVEDAEVSEDPSIEIADKETYSVSLENILLIPETEDAALSRPEFKLRQSVLALFPGTTCFYSAIVVSTPSKRRKTRDYLLKFADDDVPSRSCLARYVLPK